MLNDKCLVKRSMEGWPRGCPSSAFKRSLYRLCLVIVELARYSCAVSALADGKRKIETITFSAFNTVDQSNIAKRDRARPFYFNIENLTDHYSLPFTVDIGSDFRVWLDERTPRAAGPVASSARSLALASGVQGG